MALASRLALSGCSLAHACPAMTILVAVLAASAGCARRANNCNHAEVNRRLAPVNMRIMVMPPLPPLFNTLCVILVTVNYIIIMLAHDQETGAGLRVLPELGGNTGTVTRGNYGDRGRPRPP